MFGIDISNHQRGINLSTAPFDFAFVKATEGINFTDPSFTNHIEQLTRLNKRIGVYHYARPDNRPGLDGARKEAEWFYETVKKAGIINRVIMCLDWEQAPTNKPEWVIEFLETIRAKTGRNCFLYANSSVLSTKDFVSIVQNYPIWLAKWPASYTISFPPDMDFVNRNLPKVDWWNIWQLSSSGIFPGWNGRIDIDYTLMSTTEWDYRAGIETYNPMSAMDWAIRKGLFRGDSNGEMRPNDPITREEVATVLERFYAMIVEEL